MASTTKFGEIEYTPDDVLILEEGLLGFPTCSQFLVIEHKPQSPFKWLQSIDEPGLAFLIANPGFFAADYSPDLPEEDAKKLNISAETAMLVYAIVTIPKGKPDEMTINLAGPIVINAETQRGRQIVLEDSRYSIKFSPNSTVQTAQPAAA